jgi:hypothetical protein
LTPARSFLAKTVLSLLDWWDPELVLGSGSAVLGTITSDEEMRKMLKNDGLRWKRGCKVIQMVIFLATYI